MVAVVRDGITNWDNYIGDVNLGMSESLNMIHASDSAEAAKKEMGLIFCGEEVFSYESGSECLIYTAEERGS